MFTTTDASTTPNPNTTPPKQAATSNKPERSTSGDEVSEAEARKLRELRETDARVRRYEEAHRAAAGALYRGGPNYKFETGPDGKRYAVAGSVQIDTSPGRTPEETIQKAARIRRAALAPADPSGSDRAVASKATRMEDAARRALVRKSISGNVAPEISSRTQAVPPIRDDAAEAPGDRDDNEPPKAERREPMTVETLSPGDLGGEVWATVSALSNSAQLNQDRRADEMPTPTPHVDVIA